MIGAANGIVAAVADRLGSDGLTVVGLDAEPSTRPGTRVYAVTALDRHDALVAQLEQQLGPIFALVNVAGIVIPETIANLTLANYRRQRGWMLDGPVFLMRATGWAKARRGERADRERQLRPRNRRRGDIARL